MCLLFLHPRITPTDNVFSFFFVFVLTSNIKHFIVQDIKCHLYFGIYLKKLTGYMYLYLAQDTNLET